MVVVTSPDLLAVTIILLIPGILLTALRIRVKSQKSRWGKDDWCICAAMPPYLITSIAEIMLSINGMGFTDQEIVEHQVDSETGMMWWFIFETTWCFTIILIKCSVCFTLLRIANGKKWAVYPTYASMFAFTVVLLATAIYEYCQCTPIQYNWDHTIKGGKCYDPTIVTAFSYSLSAVNIVTDWFCAILPIPLLWNVQIERKLKVSIAFILGVGAIASIAAVIRLGITVNLSSTSNFLKNNEEVTVLTQVEMGLGCVVANLPALRPLFSRYVLKKSSSAEASGPVSGQNAGWNSRSRRSRVDRSYHELETMKGSSNVVSTTIRANRTDDSSLDDSNSQKHIVTGGIRVQNELDVAHQFV